MTSMTSLMVIPLKETSLWLKGLIVLVLGYLFWRYLYREINRIGKEVISNREEYKASQAVVEEQYEEMKETTVSKLEQSIETKSVKSSDLVYENISIEELIDCFLKYLDSKDRLTSEKGASDYEIVNEKGMKIFISEENLLVRWFVNI